MRLLIIQHMPKDHVGRFRPMLARDGIETRSIVAAEAAARGWPATDSYDALWVMGGAMQVWELEQHPWLAAEFALIRGAVAEARKPYLGICFGHQLLATALGGVCGRADRPEIGVLPVARSGSGDLALGGLSPEFPAFQWHSAEVSTPPAGVRIGACSDRCRIQTMALGDHALSVQFHPEADAETVSEWLADPAARGDVIRHNGPGADTRLLEELARHEAALAALADAIYRDWMEMAREALGSR